MDKKICWPEGKDFAFTVFDDTDLSTIENVAGVYSFLLHNGFRTTKSVWPIRGYYEPRIGGITCEDKDYLQWVKTLQKNGFEIGFHNATYHSSIRKDTIRGLERFAELFGHYPKSMSNHVACEESLYWRSYRVTGLHRFLYTILLHILRKKSYHGHVEHDKYFWGDICQKRITYVRNFVFPEINTLKLCPFMPYHDPIRPYVNYWFASSDGSEVSAFNRCITEKQQDRLESEGGACIMYTHFAKGFSVSGKINTRFKFLMERLGKKNGWFVPVSDLLDFLLKTNGYHEITNKERSQIERKWLLYKLKVRTT